MKDMKKPFRKAAAAVMAAAMCGELKIPLFMPELHLCTDNGAMIGSAAYYRLRNGELAGLDLNAMPALRLV